MTRRFQAFAVLVVLLAMSATAVADVTTSFYGYIKLDASYDSAMTNDGDFAYIVLPYEDGEEDDEFNMTAKQTRFGVKFNGGGTDAVDMSGVIEFDFYGGGAENKPNPMLRKAYMLFKTSAVDILAGQTSDVISPIVPTTLNYIVMWKSGDIGYRRPQIRLTKAVAVADNAKLKFAVSANRSMGRDKNGGETVGMPSFQGRVAVGTKIMGQAMEFGVSGLMGREEAIHADTETIYELDSSVVAVDVTLPLGDMVALKGQYFTGKNLSAYLGGIGQGIATVQPEGDVYEELVEIEASGWWAQLTVKPVENWQFNVGAGWDDPEIDDLVVGEMLDKNTTYFGNAIWTVTPSAAVGVEYTMIETEYRFQEEEERAEVSNESYQNSRLQLSFMYKF
ncbi:MAG: porin [Candidatus Eisenbacteria bacterium]|nr:porin [Candidatus Eisenbacteria bacterium]